MNTIKFIIVVSMVLLASDLLYHHHQVVNGQESTYSEDLELCMQLANITFGWENTTEAECKQLAVDEMRHRLLD